MNSMRKTILVGASILTLALSACGGGGGNTASPTSDQTSPSGATAGSPDEGSTSPDTGAAAVELLGGPEGTTSYLVESNPDFAAEAAEIIASGTLQAVTRPGVPPYEFIVEGTDELRGSDIDIAHAIAAKLGLEIEFHYSEFAGILPAMEAGRYDFSISSMGDTPERQKMVDFVDYSTESNSIVTTVGNPHNITGIDSLCGLNISSVEGSVMLALLEQQNEECDPKMNITIFPDNANALLQVQTGRADATMYQTGTTAYLIKTSESAQNLLIIDNTEFGKGYNAIALSKENSALRDLIQAALIELQEDGIYEAIHVAWGLELNMIDEITVNDGLKYNQPS